MTSTFHFTTIVDLSDGSFVSMAPGQTTHIGKVDMYTYGRMDPSTLTPLCVKAVMTAANGDQLWAEGVGDHAEYTGGTGRFEGASGRTTWESDLEDLESKLDGETITLILTYNYSMGSTLTY